MAPEDIIRIRDILPTSLGTEEIRAAYAADILRRSFFSARMEEARYLAEAREACARVASGEWDPATARDRLGTLLEGMGMTPTGGDSITNPASVRRLDLILKTNTRMAASVSRLAAQTPSTLRLWPAWELRRAEPRERPRPDWADRWRAAGEACGWEGAAPGPRMVALKGSPVWDALGAGAGGYADAVGNPYPPFAFGSGLNWYEVGAEEAAALGLDPGDATGGGAVAPRAPTLAPDPEELRRAAEETGLDLDALMEEYG